MKKENKSRYLIVIENKESEERFLFSPFNYKNIVPEGYCKITHEVPLNEEKYGHLQELGKTMSDYEKVYLDKWKEIVEYEDGNVDLDQVKKELADYSMILGEVPIVYEHLTGLSKPHTRASAIISIVEDKFIRRQDTFDDLLQHAEDGIVTISVESLKEYLLN